MSATLPRRAFLGAELPGDAEAFTAEGMHIAGVLPGGMAEAAGVRAGDTIYSIASYRVRSLAELSRALRLAGAATITDVTILRNGERLNPSVDVVIQPLEQIDGARVDYGALDADGPRLRTIATVPVSGSPRGLIVFVQGIACESIDHALAPDAPLLGLVAGWTRAGYATLRFDKRGVGDSTGGLCPETDFTSELSDARHVLAHARRQATARGIPLVVFGHSVGGIVAAQLAADVAPDALAVYGTPVMRWLTCLRDSITRQLTLRGAPPDEIAARVAELDVLEQRGELNGRSAAYHAQLHALDLEAAWRTVTCPVLVVRGEHDWVVDAADQARIATLARGATTVVDVPAVDHLFGRHDDRDASLRDYGVGTFDPALVEVTLEWLDRVTLRT